MRVVTFNLHAGVDGWGRPTSVIDHVATLHADVLILPELWRGEHDHDLFHEVKERLTMDGAFATLATGERVSTSEGGRNWQPLTAHLTGERGLYFDEHRSLTRAQRARRAAIGEIEKGQWGLGLLTRFPIDDIQVIPLGRLPREKVNRAIIMAKLRDGDRLFYVIAVHGAHLSHGSYRQYQRINDYVLTLDQSLPIVLGGDFNSWRPLLRVLLPGWRSTVRARTWPARLPHSQIDHLLVRGAWTLRGGFASDGGSDHRALVCDIDLD